jgi:hypothetical protein
MQGLEIGNDQATVRVSRDGHLSLRLASDQDFGAGWPLQEGSAAIAGAEPVEPILHYCLFYEYEQLVVRLEGQAAPMLERARGQWPASVVDDELETYPHLHFLDERRTGTPWRLERWYTLAGPYLILESEQYFERPRAVQRGKNWERLIVHLRQVVDVTAWASQHGANGIGFVSSSVH